MFRRFAVVALGWLPLTSSAAEALPERFDHVTVAAAKTSIYLGTVTMTMPAFVRKNGTYASSYAAKVFPFFFSTEQGRVVIDLPDDVLVRLEKGETISFHGHGVRDDGAERRLEGTATPTDATSGKLKVRVFVSKRIELIFNTTYRFLK